jgi:hypothetical protein
MSPLLLLLTSVNRRRKKLCSKRPGAKNVAIGSREIGAKCIYLSTDYVFDGKKDTPYGEDDLPYPISVYGLSKFQGKGMLRRLRGLSDYSHLMAVCRRRVKFCEDDYQIVARKKRTHDGE